MRYLPGDSQRVRTKVPGADAVRVNVRYVGCSRTDVARWTAGFTDVNNHPGQLSLLSLPTGRWAR